VCGSARRYSRVRVRGTRCANIAGGGSADHKADSLHHAAEFRVRAASGPGTEVSRLDLSEAGGRANHFLKNGHQDIALLSFFGLVPHEIRLHGMLRPNHYGGSAGLKFAVDRLAVAFAH
jgi:hypothetical protein